MRKLFRPPVWKNLNNEIHEAFGRDGLGIITIKNVPEYMKSRQNLLKNGYKLSQLDPKYLKIIERELNLKQFLPS